MQTSRRTLLILTFSVLCVSAPASASQILYFAPQLPCSGVPLACYPGSFGLPVLWHGPVYVPIDLPASALIEEIDLWGDSAQLVGIWDSVTQPPPFNPISLPHDELVGFAPGDLQYSFTFFARNFYTQEPYFETHWQLLHPFLLAAGRYYVGVNGWPMAGASNVIFFTDAFTSEVTPMDLRVVGYPGVAIRIIGQEVVPEPSTLLLMLPGAALLWRRARARSRAR